MKERALPSIGSVRLLIGSIEREDEKARIR